MTAVCWRPERSGEALRDAGMARALKSNSAEWQGNALRWLRIFSMQHSEGFTAEQFRARLVEICIDPPHSHNAWGALFNRAAKVGLIFNTGRYVRATSAKTRAHPVPVWMRKA